MRTGAGNRRWTATVLAGTALFSVAACGGSSHTSNATACRSVVSDLHKVATAFTTIATKPKQFTADEPALTKALQDDVKNVAKGSLKPAVNDFVAHLKNVGAALQAGKPPSAADATAFGVDGRAIDKVCSSAGVPANSK
jgi:hypothetical protein